MDYRVFVGADLRAEALKLLARELHEPHIGITKGGLAGLYADLGAADTHDRPEVLIVAYGSPWTPVGVLGLEWYKGMYCAHVYVIPSLRRQGIGSTLVETLRHDDETPSGPYYAFYNDASEAFYHRHGIFDAART